MALKHSGIGIGVLLVLQIFWLETSYSQLPASPAIGAERARQQEIYQSRGDKVPPGYVIDRSLISYSFILPAAFDRSLASLGPSDRWLDIGAGRGQAILDYYAPRYDAMHREGRERRGTKAQAVAISIEDRRTPEWEQTAATLEANKIRYVFGRRLREYSVEELGKFQVISDVLGGFSYTESMALFMEKALGFLQVNGIFYTLLLDVNPQNGSERRYGSESPFLTELANPDGSELRVCSWLKAISCVEVTCEPKTKPPIEGYSIRKVCDNVSVPALVPIHYEAGTPPARRFKLKNPLPGQTGATH